jgi:ABC-type dipeptide/oligopeptide/nickel transport system permease component
VLHFGVNEEGLPASVWISFASGYVALLIGSFLGVVCRDLIARRRKGQRSIQIISVLRNSLSQIELWVSFLGSPLIFGWILRVGADLSFGAFLYFALQTGFSSYILLDAMIGSAPSEGGAATGGPAATPVPPGLGGSPSV